MPSVRPIRIVRHLARTMMASQYLCCAVKTETTRAALTPPMLIMVGNCAAVRREDTHASPEALHWDQMTPFRPAVSSIMFPAAVAVGCCGFAECLTKINASGEL